MSSRTLARKSPPSSSPTLAPSAPPAEVVAPSETIAPEGAETPAPEGEIHGPPAPVLSPSETFAAVLAAKLSERDPATGALPMVALDAVKNAFTAVPKGERALLLLSEQQKHNTAATADPLAVDVSLLLALPKVGAHLAEVAAEPKRAAKKVAPVVDPLSEVAAHVASLTSVSSLLLAFLSDADRATVETKVAALLPNLTTDRLTFPTMVTGRRAKSAAKVRTSGGSPSEGRDIGALIAGILSDQEVGSVLSYAAIISAAKTVTGCDTIGGSVSFALDSERISSFGAERTTMPKTNKDGTVRDIKAVRVLSHVAPVAAV